MRCKLLTWITACELLCTRGNAGVLSEAFDGKQKQELMITYTSYMVSETQRTKDG